MSAAGSATPLPKKLGLGPDVVFTVRRAPAGFTELLGDTGGAIWQQSLLAPLDVVVAFHTHVATLRADWPKLTAAVEPDGVVWVAWPKRTSPLAGELTEDVLRTELLPTGWVDTKVVAIDADWSALRFNQRVERRRPKDRARR